MLHRCVAKMNLRHPHDLHLEEVLRRSDPFEHAIVPAGDPFEAAAPGPFFDIMKMMLKGLIASQKYDNVVFDEDLKPMPAHAGESAAPKYRFPSRAVLRG
jgi:hypothetical protein